MTLQIFDPRTLSLRPATQDDLDLLTRTKAAFFHLASHLRVLIPQILAECEQMIDGSYQDAVEMTPEELEIFMKVEDYRQELLGEMPHKPEDGGMIVLDHEFQPVCATLRITNDTTDQEISDIIRGRRRG